MAAIELLVLVVALSAVEVTPNPIFGGLHPAATTPYTHISSFLNQRRSTSLGTDAAPNPDLEFGTTTGPTVLIGRVLGNIRDRVSNAIAQGRDEGIFADRIQLEEAKPAETDPGDTTTEFKGLTLDEDSDGPNVVFETANNTSEDPGNLGPEEGSSNGDGLLAAKFKNKTRALATLVFTPLLSVWTTAHRNLHFPGFGGDSSGSGGAQEESQEQELEQSTDGVQSWIKGGTKQNFHETPFRRAFSKYLNFAGTAGLNNNDNPSQRSPEAARSASATAAKSEANLDNGGLDDDEDKPSAADGPRLMLSEGLGIYVLEIIGTIVGLTWGAISQIQNIFGGRQ